VPTVDSKNDVSVAEPLWLPLGELLVERGLLSKRQLELALVEQRRTGRRIGEVLVGFGYVSEQALATTLLEQVGLAAAAANAAAQVEEPQPEPDPAEEEPQEEVRPAVIRVEDLARKRADRGARVAALEALVGDFERRSDEIQQSIAQIRGLLAELKTPAA
jgi:hypothetical protein